MFVSSRRIRKNWIIFGYVVLFTIYITRSVFVNLSFIEEKYKISQYYSFSSIKTVLDKEFLINNENMCKQDNPRMIIVIPSKPEHMIRRQAIRATYGSLSRDKISALHDLGIQHIIRLAFFTGKTNKMTFERELSEESRLHQDIIKMDIYDSYYNLTLKMLYAFKWVDKFCPEAQYVLKADDDVFVNIPLLINAIHSSKHSQNGTVFGYIFKTYEHFVVQRENSKWSVGYNEYPLKLYPPYAQGTSYTLTRNLIPKIVESAQFLPYLHIEDVFITGVICGNIHGAMLVHLNGTSTWGDPTPKPCWFVETGRIAQTKMNSERMFATWRALQDYTLNCRLYRTRKRLPSLS